ncbi:MAG: hypothetical protein AB1394_13715 [Bacteroidota bacterium]
MLKQILGIVIILLVSFSTVSNAQGKLGFVGKIFDKKEANILFGEVKSSLELKPNVLKQALLKAKDYVVFVVKNGKISIVNEKKQVLAGEVRTITNNDALIIFSKDQVAGFVSIIGSSPIMVEERSSTTTLTAAEYTLEFALTCPPICYE